MISRSPTWTKVTLSLPIAVRSILTGPSKWMVTAWPVCGLLTLTREGIELLPGACPTLMVAFIPAPALQFRTGVGAGYMERARALAPCDIYVFLVVTQGQPIKWKHVNSTQPFVGVELFLALTELLRGLIWSFSVVDKESCVCDVRLHVRPRARSALAAKTARRLWVA